MQCNDAWWATPVSIIHSFFALFLPYMNTWKLSSALYLWAVLHCNVHYSGCMRIKLFSWLLFLSGHLVYCAFHSICFLYDALVRFLSLSISYFSIKNFRCHYTCGIKGTFSHHFLCISRHFQGQKWFFHRSFNSAAQIRAIAKELDINVQVLLDVQEEYFRLYSW